jgi:predicted enzyme related to lactoylglutathione lyase
VPVRQRLLGTPCWIDLMSSDASRAVDFYTGLFGWTAERSDDPQYGGYTVLSIKGGVVAGVGQAPPDVPFANVWTVYLEVDDLDATAGAATEAGGVVMMPAMQVGDQGSMAVVSDPSGAAIGLWLPDQHRGFGALGEMGTPMWFELMTRDYRAALQFYETVLRWQAASVGDTDEFRYSQLSLGGDAERGLSERPSDPFAGAMDAAGFLQDGVPSYWQFYLGTDDVDASIDRAKELGGSVFEEPEDTPYGRLATLADPLGAPFRVMTPPQT